MNGCALGENHAPSRVDFIGSETPGITKGDEGSNVSTRPLEPTMDDGTRADVGLSESELAEIWALYRVHLRCALRSGSNLSDRASFIFDEPLCSWSALFTRFALNPALVN